MSDRLPANPYRYGLLAVAAGQLGATLHALLAPRSFYEDFPLGRGWVAEYPSYNDHLITDYGTFTLGALVTLVLAAVWLDRRVVQVAIVGWLVGSTIHFISHVATADRLPTGDAVVNLGALFLLIAIPAWLLVKSRERSDVGPAEDPGRA
jgi:fluoride ion exporter CrcB/FEX